MDSNFYNFDIQAYIYQTLKPLGLPLAFGSMRDTGSYPFVVYSINTIPDNYYDDDYHSYTYLIGLSIYCKRGIDYSEHQQKLITIMKDAGFRLEGVPPVQYIETEEIFNQPIAFTFYNDID